MIRENEHLTKENMRLAADCDGYRNGQDQLQDILNTVMDSNAKLAEENKRIVELTVELEKLKKLPDMLIGFIPEGWGMPLGWGQLVAQVKQALKGEEGCHGL